jgi:glycosyltransferase involved in cell wall biosynthesis
VVTTVPNVCDVVGRLGAARIVYYCVDDFSEWPGMDRDRVLAMEEQLLRSVDHVACTSSALLARFSPRHPCSLLTHGVDIDLFASEAPEDHPVLRDIPGPRVGYFGLLDARSDTALLEGLAGSLPDVSFVFTGPVESCPRSLRERKNMRFTGPVPYAELPAVVRGWKACLLPYRLNELTRKINPLKLKEYLATGKPVISTPLPEARELAPFVTIADGLAQWTEAVRRAVAGGLTVDEPALRSFLAGHSWSAKAAELLRVCQMDRSPVGAA